MLTEVAPADQPVRVADLLDRSRQILISEEDIPEHRAAILHMLAAYYLSSGKPAQADELLARSLELTKATSDTRAAGHAALRERLCGVAARATRRRDAHDRAGAHVQRR